MKLNYYISSLPLDVELFARTVRGHWLVEVMHWHLDVTFREDANTAMDKTVAQNLNIINKWCLSILKLFEVGRKMSIRKNRILCLTNVTLKTIILHIKTMIRRSSNKTTLQRAAGGWEAQGTILRIHLWVAHRKAMSRLRRQTTVIRSEYRKSRTCKGKWREPFMK